MGSRYTDGYQEIFTLMGFWHEQAVGDFRGVDFIAVKEQQRWFYGAAGSWICTSNVFRTSSNPERRRMTSSSHGPAMGK